MDDEEFEPYQAPPTVYFGQRWDAPLLDGNVVQVDVPVGRVCLYCSEPIAVGDRGLMRMAMRGTLEAPTASQEPVHMECELRMVLGDVAHLEGRCSCAGRAGAPAAAGSYREESLGTLAWVNQRRAASGMPPM